MTFGFDSSQMCVAITITNDLTVESNEQFTVVLESTDPAVQLIFSTATIIIIDSGECMIAAQKVPIIFYDGVYDTSMPVNILTLL